MTTDSVTGIPVTPLIPVTVLLMLGAGSHQLAPVPWVNIDPAVNLQPLPVLILIPPIPQTALLSGRPPG